jgi:hypothetical protein
MFASQVPNQTVCFLHTTHDNNTRIMHRGYLAQLILIAVTTLVRNPDRSSSGKKAARVLYTKPIIAASISMQTTTSSLTATTPVIIAATAATKMTTTRKVSRPSILSPTLPDHALSTTTTALISIIITSIRNSLLGGRGNLHIPTNHQRNTDPDLPPRVPLPPTMMNKKSNHPTTIALLHPHLLQSKSSVATMRLSLRRCRTWRFGDLKWDVTQLIMAMTRAMTPTAAREEEALRPELIFSKC